MIRTPRRVALPMLVLAFGAVVVADEVAGLVWCPANRECLEWTDTPSAIRYRLYRGERPGLPALLDVSIDSCTRSDHEAATSGRSVFEAPDPGGLFWYLVVAEDAQGFGSAGDATSGVRLLDSAGECPFACNPDYEPNPNVGLSEPPGGGGCPDGMLAVDTFCIDRFEAALVRVDNGEPWSPFVNPDGVATRAVSLPGAIPQAYIRQTQAADACAQAGKRLCTDGEWLRACGGPTGTTYPYGDVHVDEACNDHRATHPLIDYFETTEPWIWSETDHPCLNQLPEGLEAGGNRSSCVTFEGALDMVGNLHEWTSDPSGTTRGGNYVESTINGSGCNYVTTAHSVGHFDYGVGFRCCADP